MAKNSRYIASDENNEKSSGCPFRPKINSSKLNMYFTMRTLTSKMDGQAMHISFSTRLMVARMVTSASTGEWGQLLKKTRILYK